MKPIYVIGSANADFTLHADRLPKLGETLSGRNFSVNIGGKGLNQAVAVSRLGGNARFIGAVGHDVNGAMLLKAMADNHVAFDGICTENATTGMAMITVVNGDNCILLHAGANACVTPGMLTEKKTLIQDAAAVIFQLEIPLETVMLGAHLAHDAEVPVFLNPAPSAPLANDLYPLIDYLIPNEHEAFALSAIPADTEDGCRENIRFFREKGVKNVLITRGEMGCAYNMGNEIRFCPAVKTQAVDTTSAGDTFVGALCVQLMQGKALPDAVEYACRACAITVSRPGAAASIPFASELQ